MAALRVLTLKGATAAAALALEQGEAKETLDALKFLAQVSGLTKSDDGGTSALTDQERALLDEARKRQQ